MLTEIVVARRESTALVPIQTIPVMELQTWANRITRAAGQAVEAIVTTGRLLTEAKRALPHGGFERLFKGHPDAVAHPVPFTAATARMYRAIARHPVLSNRNHGNDLPASWRTLYVLARMPDPVVKTALTRGEIHPELTRREAIALRERDCPKRPARDGHTWGAGEDVAKTLDAQAHDEEVLRRSQDQLAAAMREPLVIGEDGRLRAGVLWIPPFTDAERTPTPPPPKPRHRCVCGHEHVDRRPVVDATGYALP